MNDHKIKCAEYEAHRFLERISEYRDEERRFPDAFNANVSGALRRASMDLTRALAKMRTPE